MLSHSCCLRLSQEPSEARLSTVNLNRQVYLALAEGRDGAVNSVYVEGLALAVENAGLAVAQKLWIAATGTFDHEASTSLVV